MEYEWLVPPLRPSDVPDLRTGLLEKLRSGNPHRQLFQVALDATPDELSAEELNLRDSALFWVSGDMQDIIEVSAAAIPDEITVDETTPPCGESVGFVVFERPISCPDYQRPGETMHFSAFRYQPLYRYGLGRMSGRSQEDPHWAIHLTFYSYGPGSLGLYPNGQIEWWFNKPVTHLVDIDADLTDDLKHDMFMDRRRFMAFSLLVNQRVLADVTESEGSRSVRRRSERAGVASTVKIVALRRLSSGTAHVGHDPVAWSHRWIVNGHWRHQPCGPGRSQRRWTFIAPHIKGPDDKPLVLKETVRAVVR